MPKAVRKSTPIFIAVLFLNSVSSPLSYADQEFITPPDVNESIETPAVSPEAVELSAPSLETAQTTTDFLQMQDAQPLQPRDSEGEEVLEAQPQSQSPAEPETPASNEQAAQEVVVEAQQSLNSASVSYDPAALGSAQGASNQNNQASVNPSGGSAGSVMSSCPAAATSCYQDVDFVTADGTKLPGLEEGWKITDGNKVGIRRNHTYDSQNRLIRREETTWNTDGTYKIETSDVTTYVYDSAGRVKRQTEQFNYQTWYLGTSLRASHKAGFKARVRPASNAPNSPFPSDFLVDVSQSESLSWRPDGVLSSKSESIEITSNREEFEGFSVRHYLFSSGESYGPASENNRLMFRSMNAFRENGGQGESLSSRRAWNPDGSLAFKFTSGDEDVLTEYREAATAAVMDWLRP